MMIGISVDKRKRRNRTRPDRSAASGGRKVRTHRGPTGHVRWRKDRQAWEVSVEAGEREGRRLRWRKIVRGNRSDAQAALAELLREAERTDPTPRPDMRFHAWLTLWLERKRPELRPSSYESYAKAIKRGRRVLPDLLLDSLRAEHFGRLVVRLRGAGYADRTVLYTWTVLKEAVDDAVRAGLIARSPFEGLVPPKVRRGREAAALEPEDARRFLEQIADHPKGPLWATLILSGLRLGEALALRWSDVDLENLVLRVDKTVYVPRRRDERDTDTKTPSGRRVVAIPAELVPYLDRQRQWIDRLRREAGDAWIENGLVFPDRLGRRQAPQTVDNLWRKASRRLGFEGYRLHDLRHSYITLSLLAGADPLTVSRQVGHANPAFTLRTYGHLLQRAQREAADRLGSLLGGGRNGGRNGGHRSPTESLQDPGR